MNNKTEWRNWSWIARAIAAGAKREEIAEYLERTKCRYCETVTDNVSCHCDQCPLDDAETDDCAGGHYGVVFAWLKAVYSRRPTRAQALKSARIIAEVTRWDKWQRK